MKKIPIQNLPTEVTVEMYEEWLAQPLTQLWVASLQLQLGFVKQALSEVDSLTLETQRPAMMEWIASRDVSAELLTFVDDAEGMKNLHTRVMEALDNEGAA